MAGRLGVELTVLTLLGCASAGSAPQLAPGSPGYVAPSNRTIVAEVDPSYDAQEIYIQNNSSAAIEVTSVTIVDCINVTPCGLVPLADRVDPRQRRKVASVKAVDANEAWSYRYRWTWSTAPSH